MGMTRKGNSRFFRGFDKNGNPSYRAVPQEQSVGRRIAKKIVEPVHALAGEVSFLSYYANDLMIRLSLKIDEILDEAKVGLEESMKSLAETEWAAPVDDVRDTKETEKQVLAALEKFASRTSR